MAVGGEEHTNAETYDFKSNSWTDEKPYPPKYGDGIQDFSMIYLADLESYIIIGGWYEMERSHAYIAKFYRYNGEYTWTIMGSLNRPRYVSF